MGTTQARVMNRAAIECGHERIVTATQNSEAGRVFADIYSEAVDYCLEEADWAFCLKRATSTGTVTTDQVPFKYEHSIPADFIRLSRIRADGYNTRSGSLDYDKAEGKLYTHDEIIDYAYVSSIRGRDEEFWPETFSELVALTLADRGVMRLAGSAAKREEIRKSRKRAKWDAVSFDQTQRAPRKLPTGSWVTAHYGGGSVIK